MDLGLYNLKYPARKLLEGLLPRFREIDPNHISLAMLPVGLLTAATYGIGAQGLPGLYLLAIVLIFGRMFLGTMDGLVATHFGKGTPLGEMVNRVAPELCDLFYLVALALARPEWHVPGTLAIGMAWLVSFSGLVGATVGLPTQSVGPTGQTDRLVALQLLSLLAFLSDINGWGVDFLGAFLWWVAIGSLLTIGLRLQRNFKGDGSSR